MYCRVTERAKHGMYCRVTEIAKHGMYCRVIETELNTVCTVE